MPPAGAQRGGDLAAITVCLMAASAPGSWAADMANDRPLPDSEDAKFWPQLVQWQTREVEDAHRDGRTEDARTWQRLRAEAVSTWADQASGSAKLCAHLKATRLPDGSASRGRKGR